jgi:GMP synthase-like glutamine amidotransferase
VKRIGVLRMTELPDGTFDVHGSYLDVFRMMFADQDVELVDVPVHIGSTPGSLSDADIWIITGSPASVYDDLPWIATAEEIVREAARSETSLFGICFGHQLVAQAMGGRVERAPVGWGIGALGYATIADVPHLDLPASLTLIASHQDQVTIAPDDAVVWSTADYCPIAGLVIGERMWTVQGHPEFTPELARAIYTSRRDRIGSELVDRALATLDRPLSNRAIAAAVLAASGC